jgi:hypothetical protein
MKRREALAVITLAVSGCQSRSGFHEINSMKTDSIDWERQIATQAAAVDDVATFDPALLGLLSTFVFHLLRYCLAQHIRKMHAAVVKRPDGKVARKLKARLGEQFLAAHAGENVEPAAVEAHVARIVSAFAAASEQEVANLIQAVRNSDETDTDDWINAKLADELVAIGEEDAE